MLSKYGILSLLLSFVVFLLFLKDYEIWTQPIEWGSGKEVVRKTEKKTETTPVMGDQKETASVKSYISIAEKNIFSPERRDFPLPMEAKKPLVRPQIVLYGVTIVRDYQAASVTNPGRPLHKGERETMTLKIGDKVGEYTLAKISSDRISLEAPGDTFEVLLYDSKVPKKRMDVKTEIKPATVTSSQPVPAGISPKTTTPASPPISTEVTKPAPPKETIAPTPPPTTPMRPTFPSRRQMFYPPAGAPTQQPGGGN